MKVKITQTKSAFGALKNHRETLRSLSLKRPGNTTIREMDPVLDGMLKTVRHLVNVEEVF
jgi:large subunit ribosomal protein L30